MITSSPVDILNWQRLINGHTALSTAAKTVAFEISLHINSASGICWPGMQRLADRTHLNLSTVKRAVKRLSTLGLITIQRTGRTLIYSLMGGTRAPSDSAPVPPERAKGTCKFSPPTPPQRALVDQAESEAAPAPAPEAAPAPAPEPAPEADPETAKSTASDSAAPDEVAALIAYFWTISGTKADGPRHRKALQRALKSNTADEIKEAAKAAKGTWSNPAWVTPAAVCKPGRVDELRSQGKASGVLPPPPKPYKRPQVPVISEESRRIGLEALKALKATLAGAR